MYVDKCTAHANGKTYTRYLLRESRREGKKTIKTTILNITPWGERTCEALRFALSNQKRWEIGIKVADLRKTLGDMKLTQQSPVGEVDATVEENLSALSGLCGVRMSVPSGEEVYLIPKPRPELNKLFDLTNTTPPTILPAGKTNADTERKL